MKQLTKFNYITIHLKYMSNDRYITFYQKHAAPLALSQPIRFVLPVSQKIQFSFHHYLFIQLVEAYHSASFETASPETVGFSNIVRLAQTLCISYSPPSLT